MVETMSNVGWQVIWGKGVEGEKRRGAEVWPLFVNLALRLKKASRGYRRQRPDITSRLAGWKRESCFEFSCCDKNLNTL